MLARLIESANLVEDTVDVNPLHAQVFPAMGSAVIERAEAGTARDSFPEHVVAGRAGSEEFRVLGAEQSDDVNGSKRGKVRRTTVVGDQYFRQAINHQQLLQRRLTTEVETAG